MRKILFFILIFLGTTLALNAKAGIIIRPVLNTGLVGYWDFQEGAGNKAYDKSGYDNDGTWSGAGSYWADGKIGKGGNFNGSDDVVQITDSPLFTVNTTDNITYAAWIKLAESPSGYVNIVGDWNGPCFQFNGNELNYYAGSEKKSGVLSWTVGQWYHVAVVVNNTISVTWYRNGVYVNSVANSNQTNRNPDYFDIGADENGEYFNGVIDEVRIYNRALSESEISRLYKMSSPRINVSQANLVTDGLVGYWSFNGPDISGTDAFDRSGQGNHGTISGATKTIGKVGQALSFDGADYVDAGAGESLNIADAITISFWIKGTYPQINEYGPVIYKRGTYGWLVQARGTTANIYVRIDTSAGSNQSTGDLSVLDGAWHHVVWVLNSGSRKGYKDAALVVDNSYNHGTGLGAATDDLIINHPYGEGFNGSMDEVRVYNRALEPSEINALYRAGSAQFNASQNNQLTDGLVGFWSFNGPDISGTDAFDRSGQGNHGVISGATKTIGKIGQALNFDGSSNYVSSGLQMTDNQSFTYSAWFNAKTLSDGHHAICGNDNTQGTPDAMGAAINYYGEGGNGTIFAFIADANGTDNLGPGYNLGLSLNAWHHVALVYNYNASRALLYVDGVFRDDETVNGFAADDYPNSFSIGRHYWGGYYFDGKIDEVRVYNRALSSEEIRRLYNLGR